MQKLQIFLVGINHILARITLLVHIRRGITLQPEANIVLLLLDEEEGDARSP